MPSALSTKDKEELAMKLLEIMEKGKDTVAPKISALLVEFAKVYNAEQIAEILNTVPEESGCSVLDWAMSCRMGECEKILLMNGAIPQTNRNWSVLYGKIILASMQEKLGADFHPVFIEHTHHLEQQLSDLEYFLIQAKAIAQTNKSQVNLTLIIADDYHWRTVQIQVYPGKKAQLKMFFMSSIAKDEPENFDIKLSKLASGIFGSINTELYINMLPLQKDGISCRIIALKITRMFHSMLHGKYKDRHPDFDIFASLGLKEGKDSTIVVDGLTFHQVDKLPSKIMQLDQYLRTTTSTPDLPTSSDGTELGTTKHRFGAERPHKDQLKQWNIKFEHLIDKFKLNLNNFLSLFRNNHSSLNDLANKFSSGSLVSRSESDSDRESKSPGL